jgi:preprotein translocase subunit SecG
MGALTAIVYILHVLVSIFLILVVLLQQGKGADLSVFGGGSTQAAFGARSAATLFQKLTVVGFIVFTLTTLTLAGIEAKRHKSSVVAGSLAEEAPAATTPAASEPAPATTAPAAEGVPPAATPEAGSPAAGTPNGTAETPTAPAPAPQSN